VPSESASEIAEILKDYVPRADYDRALEALDEVTRERDTHSTELEKHRGRVGDLEKTVRGRAAKDAFAKVVDKLKIDQRFADHVFELAKVPADADEPDAAALENHVGAWLKQNPAFVRTETAKPTTIPAGEGHDRGRSVRPGEPELRVSRAQLKDAVWMRENQQRVGEAQKAGLFVLED
jgi:hypothetical protein